MLAYTCDACDDGYVEHPATPGTCIADPCGVGACNSHGTCSVGDAGEAVCTCETGYAGTDCATCDAGYTEHPAGSGLCIEDACMDVDCGDHGACFLDTAGAALCECEAGYTGDACDACDTGFIDDPQNPGTCIEDPCTDVDCGTHGSCSVGDDGAAFCECAAGYAGEACDTCDETAGYIESRANPGRCILDPCGTNDCSGNGTCSLTGGDLPVCLCDTGWAGNTCGECAEGYTEFPAGTCVLDPCIGYDCGANALCSVDVGGNPVCSCETGYTGTGCAECDAGYIEDPGAPGVCIEDPCLGVSCNLPDACNAAGDSLLTYTGVCTPQAGGSSLCESTVVPCASGVCSGGACEPVLTAPLPGDLAITEIMITPPGVTPATDGQWFEIVNLSAAELDLSGVVVDVGGTTVTFPASVILGVGDQLVVGPNDDSATNGGVAVDVPLPTLPALTVATNFIDLFAADGTTQLDTVVWDDTWNHLTGRSLTLSPAATDPINENDVAAAWCFAQDGTGSPGAVNEPCAVDWCNTQSPASLMAAIGAESENVFGQVYEANLTEGDSQTPFIQAQLGWGADGVLPDATWTWTDAAYNPAFDAISNDEEFMAALTIPAVGSYDYAYRMSRDGGLSWTLCDLDGSDNSYDAAQAGDAEVLGPPPELIFSEYIEGSSNNKAFEIYNAGTSEADLSTCSVVLYSNGSTTPTNTLALSTTTLVLDAGLTFVVCNTQADATLQAACDLITGTATGFNGDDALELVCGVTTLDVIGQIGVDPGSAWGSGDVMTVNDTLRRKCGITTGDTDGSDAFDPTGEWDGFSQDTFDGLGTHSVICVDPCDGVTCSGFGTCGTDTNGDALCTCDAGYITDPADATACIADPCLTETCSDNGTCSVDAQGAAVCTCDTGYTGTLCADCDAGYVADPQNAGACIVDPCIGFDCGNGTCGLDTAANPVCTCDAGYTGTLCADCDTGYVLIDGACVADACSGVNCGDNGSCVLDGSGAAVCSCAEGYTGAACDACDSAGGYVPNPQVTGMCIVDPCATADCNRPDECNAAGDAVVTYDGFCTVTGEASFVCDSTETTCTSGACTDGACVVADLAGAGDLAITEILIDGAGQFIELHNVSGAVRDLNGLRVTIDGTQVAFPATPLLFAADARLVVGPNADTATNGGIVVDVELPGLLQMVVAGGHVEIHDASGTALIDDVLWDDTWNHLGGKSLTLSPAASTPITQNDSAASWCFAQVDAHSAGEPNAPCEVDWCNTQSPTSTTFQATNPSEPIFGQVWEDGFTLGDNPSPHIKAQLGYGADGVTPDATWTWTDAVYNTAFDVTSNDEEFMAQLTVPAEGTYDYAYRMSLDGGLSWKLCDVNGSDDGYEPAQAGEAVVTAPPAIELFFSEYVEGSSNNKAYEIYNAGTAGVDLSQCQVKLYTNGTATTTTVLSLATNTLVLDPGAAFVVCNNQSITELQAYCDLITGTTTAYNGDDALELLCGGVTLDVIGQIGFDPGSVWGSGDVTTVNDTLRRKCGIISGDPDGSDAFDPSVEWDGFPEDTFEGLGSHSVACVADPCDGVTCNAQGTCQATGETYVCACDAGYDPNTDCGTCAADYDLVDGACINTQTVACDASTTPANATPNVVDVTITYTDAGGWTDAEACAWACDADYELVDGACINTQTVSCDASTTPANATPTVVDVTITYTDAGGWTDAEACAWTCETGYTGDLCDTCDSASGYVENPYSVGVCILDPCPAANCGANAYCEIDTDGSALCLCDAGYHLDALTATCVQDAIVGWCNVQAPKSYTGATGQPEIVYGQVYVAGVTDPAGRAPNLTGQLCSSASPILETTTIDTLDCVPATYNVDSGNNDEYMGPLIFETGGTFEYVYAFSGDGGNNWTLCDADDSAAWLAGTATIESQFVNGSFEDWDTAVTVPDGWTADSGVGVAREATIVHEGSYSVMLTRNTETNSATDFVSSPFPVIEGESYVVNMWYFDNAGAWGTLGVQWRDDTMAAVGNAVYSGLQTSDQADWQLLTHALTAPTGAVYMEVFTRVYGTLGDSVYLDNVSVVPAP